MNKGKLLIPREKYLSAGVHIGMTSKTADMDRFIYKVRPNGLAVLNVGMLDKRIEHAANMLAGMKKILIVSRNMPVKLASSWWVRGKGRLIPLDSVTPYLLASCKIR